MLAHSYTVGNDMSVLGTRLPEAFSRDIAAHANTIFEQHHLQPYPVSSGLKTRLEPAQLRTQEKVQRRVYGAMHAARMAAWVKILSSLYNIYDYPDAQSLTQDDILLIQIAALFKDTTPISNRSSDSQMCIAVTLCLDYLTVNGVDMPRAWMIAGIIAPDGAFGRKDASICHKLLHDAAMLEKLRWTDTSFKIEEMYIYKHIASSNPDGLDTLRLLGSKITDLIDAQGDRDPSDVTIRFAETRRKKTFEKWIEYLQTTKGENAELKDYDSTLSAEIHEPLEKSEQALPEAPPASSKEDSKKKKAREHAEHCFLEVMRDIQEVEVLKQWYDKEIAQAEHLPVAMPKQQAFLPETETTLRERIGNMPFLLYHSTKEKTWPEKKEILLFRLVFGKKDMQLAFTADDNITFIVSMDSKSLKVLKDLSVKNADPMPDYSTQFGGVALSTVHLRDAKGNLLRVISACHPDGKTCHLLQDVPDRPSLKDMQTVFINHVLDCLKVLGSENRLVKHLIAHPEDTETLSLCVAACCEGMNYDVTIDRDAWVKIPGRNRQSLSRETREDVASSVSDSARNNWVSALESYKKDGYPLDGNFYTACGRNQPLFKAMQYHNTRAAAWLIAHGVNHECFAATERDRIRRVYPQEAPSEIMLTIAGQLMEASDPMRELFTINEFLLTEKNILALSDKARNDMLFQMAMHNCPKAAAFLMDQGKVPADIQNAKADTPLFFAIYHDHLEVAEVLLKHGANPYHKNKSGCSPWYLANKPEPHLKDKETAMQRLLQQYPKASPLTSMDDASASAFPKDLGPYTTAL